MNFISTKAKIINREFLTENMLDIKMKLTDRVDYAPGQFANILVEEKTWRSYSIVDLTDQVLTLLVDTKPQGPGSLFFQDTEYNFETEVMIPMGGFVVRESDKKKLFVATGTGLAPFVPMIKSLQDSGFKEDIVMLVGVRHDNEYFVDKYFDFTDSPNYTVYPCITKSKGELEGARPMRVTQLLPTLGLDLTQFDSYICGNPKMVIEIMKFVRENGGENIYTEKY